MDAGRVRLTDTEYAMLCGSHQKVIDYFGNQWNSVLDSLPTFGAKVFAILDLSSIGRGKFVSDYFYTKHGFVVRDNEDDAYGFISHWIYFTEVDNLSNFML